jgi:hypothetical protein
MQVNTTDARVSIGIDAAVMAAHQVAVRGMVREDFKIRPTLAGLAELTKRLGPYVGAMVVAEPTAGTWLPLAHAVVDAGCVIGFVANRDSARLRKAIVGAYTENLFAVGQHVGVDHIGCRTDTTSWADRPPPGDETSPHRHRRCSSDRMSSVGPSGMVVS